MNKDKQLLEEAYDDVSKNGSLEVIIMNLETIARMLKTKASMIEELGMEHVGEYIISLGNRIKNLK